ncbi:MAG: hypothetical protein OEY47_05490 [Candidatus Bathyarchaeota archaeon]|nr:hypothetical protein [Candidatus Bathyarchaeota archaeon]
MYPEIAQMMLVISGLFLVLNVVAQKVSSARASDFEKILTVTTVLGYLSLIIGIVDLIAFIIYIL